MEDSHYIALATVIFALAVVLYLKYEKDQSRRVKKAVDENVEIANNKYIVVGNVSKGVLEKILTDFCVLYNEDGIMVIPRLVVTKDDEFVVVFPSGVDFSMFSFCLNYLAYPINIDESPMPIGWGTFSSDDDVPKRFVGEQIMVVIPKNDEEFDQVMVVTDENVAYRVGFSDWIPVNCPENEMSYILSPLDFHFSAEWKREVVDFVSAKKR